MGFKVFPSAEAFVRRLTTNRAFVEAAAVKFNQKLFSSECEFSLATSIQFDSRGRTKATKEHGTTVLLQIEVKSLIHEALGWDSFWRALKPVSMFEEIETGGTERNDFYRLCFEFPLSKSNVNKQGHVEAHNKALRWVWVCFLPPSLFKSFILSLK